MYDPLLESQIPSGQNYPDSYWRSTVNKVSEYSALESDISADIVVVGSGYTGLNCAYWLAKNYQQEVVLLEANQIGWGCSGRNAGFVLKGTGRLALSDIQAKWGDETATKMQLEYQAAVDWINRQIEVGDINCDAQRTGYLKIAHKPSVVAKLKSQVEYLNSNFSDPVRFIDKNELGQYLSSPDAHSAILYPDCFGINPLKLVHGYASMAKQAGVSIYNNSAVTHTTSENGEHRVITGQGSVKCKQLVLATNGYTPANFHSLVANRSLPVLSSVIVTRPLTIKELQASGLKMGIQAMDTRELKYYYRLLPDNRILFGGRGAIQGKNAANPVFPKRLLDALKVTFPPLAALSVDYYWSGWISVSLDDIPRIWSQDNVHYSQGYCGSGVSFSALAGKRLAQSVMGELDRELPIYQTPLKKFPFAPMRRVGQWGFYQWGRFKDAYL